MGQSIQDLSWRTAALYGDMSLSGIITLEELHMDLCLFFIGMVYEGNPCVGVWQLKRPRGWWGLTGTSSSFTWAAFFDLVPAYKIHTNSKSVNKSQISKGNNATTRTPKSIRNQRLVGSFCRFCTINLRTSGAQLLLVGSPRNLKPRDG